MKTTKTFKNATLRTVHNGYIELDCNNKTHCFNNASVVSVNNGIITIEVDWKPERGELIRASGNGTCRYVIFISKEPHSLIVFGSKDISSSWYKLSPHIWANLDTVELQPVTPEEQQAFDDFCKSQGKIWNKEKLQWENCRWMPMYHDMYYCINMAPTPFVRSHVWSGNTIDYEYYKENNCFKTPEEAEAKLAQIKKLLLEV